MPTLNWNPVIPVPNDFSMGLAANTQSGGRSPFDGTEQTLELPGARWVAELRWRNLDIAEWRTLTAFVAALGGRAGRFWWPVESRFPRRGTAGGTPLVNGAGQTGRTLLTDGWGAGTAFLMGDIFVYVDPAGRPIMHQVTADVTVAGGAASIPITPPIRRSPADNAALLLVNVSPLWRPTRDDVMADYEPGDRGFALTLPIEEAIW